jgi:uncharacterized RDD family membrane protein YckC
LRPGEFAWDSTPPDPLDNPALYAGIRTRRILGYIVDLLLIAVLWGMAWVAAIVLGIVTLGLLWPVLVIFVGLVPLAYHTLTIASGSATVGMRMFDVEVRSWTGKRPDFGQALIMTAIYMITVWPTGLLILLVSLFDGRARTLHDMLSGTVVVRRSALRDAGGIAISAVATR